MSYACWGDDSDVLVYNNGKRFVCERCRLRVDRGYTRSYHMALEMVTHLREHIVAGQKVPEEAMRRLLSEAELARREQKP